MNTATSHNTGYTAQPLRGFAQICPYGQTSYSPKTLAEIFKWQLTQIIIKNMKDSIIDILSIIVLAVVLVLDIFFRNQFDSGIFLLIVSILIIIFGIIIWITGKMTLGEYFTTSVHPKGLVTKGIYSKIRHPMYYGGMIIYLGVALLMQSWVGLGLTITLDMLLIKNIYL